MTVKEFLEFVEASKQGKKIMCYELKHDYYNPSASCKYEVDFLNEDMSKICFGIKSKDDIGKKYDYSTYRYYIKSENK